MSNLFIFFLSFLFCLHHAYSQDLEAMRSYILWDDSPAPNRGSDGSTKNRGYPYDSDWEAHSYPLGNGMIGANIFGRTDEERIQLTDKTLSNGAPYGFGGITNFAEIYLEFDHYDISTYKRELQLNKALCVVEYSHAGVRYKREHFINYPQNVMMIKLKADRSKSLSFTLRGKNPYLRTESERNHSGSIVTPYQRTGVEIADSNALILKGSIPAYSLNYETQIRILTDGGRISPSNENGAEIRVIDADSVVLLIGLETNYKLTSEVFLQDTTNLKLDPTTYPHQELSSRLDSAEELGYKQLKANHLSDYQKLFSKVQFEIAQKISEAPTKQLVQNYGVDEIHDRYLEELMFHYGRYLLISSSRPKSLPSTLQGVWSQYHVTPWSGGYWHNINVQMNYWGAFVTDLSETFSSYDNYYKAYSAKAYNNGDAYIQKWYPHQYSKMKGTNGWCIGTGGTAYAIESPGGHSGPGTGGFTTKLFWDRYEFTQDASYLRDIAFPAIYGMSKFLYKTLEPTGDGHLLVSRSASPEQRHDGKYYMTKGTTFDQSFVWETFNDLLKSSVILEVKDSFIQKIESDILKLDPIHIGESGQIKEFREEKQYGEIGDPFHRHVSHLCGLYPGTLINRDRPKWMKALTETLDYRGDQSTGWAMAHRMNLRARAGQGEKAFVLYAKFLKEKTLPNLWTVHPPFQIDGNLGFMASVAEMLLQSQWDYIEPLPALTEKWRSGFLKGFVARGNFKIDIEWQNGKIKTLVITSRTGGLCRLELEDVSKLEILDELDNKVAFRIIGNNRIEFATAQAMTYRILTSK